MTTKPIHFHRPSATVQSRSVRNAKHTWVHVPIREPKQRGPFDHCCFLPHRRRGFVVQCRQWSPFSSGQGADSRRRSTSYHLGEFTRNPVFCLHLHLPSSLCSVISGDRVSTRVPHLVNMDSNDREICTTAAWCRSSVATNNAATTVVPSVNAT